MKTLEPVLAGHPFCSGLADEQVTLLVGCATNVRYPPGEFLFRAGEDAKRFFLIREGRAALEIAPPGAPAHILQTVGPGEVLGWSWLVPPYRWTFDARAIDDVRALALDGECLRRKCEQDHDLGYALLKRVASVMEERLQATRLQLLDVYGTRR